MCERLVGFGHTVNVFTFLNCSTFVVCSIGKFVRQAQSHGFITAFTSSFNDPTHCQGITTNRTNFNRNLISRTTNAAGLNFNSRAHVFESYFESFQFIFTRALSQGLQRAVYDCFCSRFFTVYHQDIYKFSQQF
ncbi:hypothetical protein EDP2_2412 [Enterobacter cloacae S611]|uniref:Uncharacterized protein n=1 Tax=Enterobacter cloacae S611 TaxID=1399146 RepID=A0ABN0Q2E5_ENTCL|nr:hypothetical protein EDP2_2412 [Enterobacter cloacae S611]